MKKKPQRVKSQSLFNLFAPCIQWIFAALAALPALKSFVWLLPFEPATWIFWTMYSFTAAAFILVTIYCDLAVRMNEREFDSELSYIASGDLNTPVFVQKVGVSKKKEIISISPILYSDEKTVIYGSPELRLVQNWVNSPNRGQYILRATESGIFFEPYIHPSAI